MPRVKGGKTSLKRRRNVLRQVKGYRYGRSKKKRQAHEAIVHAGKYAFAHRRDKKNDFRRLWNVKINAAVRENATEGAIHSYSTLIHALKKKKSTLDRKILASLAQEHLESFKRLLKQLS